MTKLQGRVRAPAVPVPIRTCAAQGTGGRHAVALCSAATLSWMDCQPHVLPAAVLPRNPA